MAAEPTHRLFFALWPDPETTKALYRIAQLASAAVGGRCMRIDTLHMTLAFLGNVDAARLPDMLAIGADLQGRAFQLVIDRLGYWRHNRIIWAGGRGAPVALADLVGKLRSSLADAGMRVDSQSFAPHVTLVRNAMAAAPPAPLERIVWQVDDFCLVESQLTGQGARYRVLARWPLDGSIG